MASSSKAKRKLQLKDSESESLTRQMCSDSEGEEEVTESEAGAGGGGTAIDRSGDLQSQSESSAHTRRRGEHARDSHWQRDHYLRVSFDHSSLIEAGETNDWRKVRLYQPKENSRLMGSPAVLVQPASVLQVEPFFQLNLTQKVGQLLIEELCTSSDSCSSCIFTHEFICRGRSENGCRLPSMRSGLRRGSGWCAAQATIQIDAFLSPIRHHSEKQEESLQRCIGILNKALQSIEDSSSKTFEGGELGLRLLFQVRMLSLNEGAKHFHLPNFPSETLCSSEPATRVPLHLFRFQNSVSNIVNPFVLQFILKNGTLSRATPSLLQRLLWNQNNKRGFDHCDLQAFPSLQQLTNIRANLRQNQNQNRTGSAVESGSSSTSIMIPSAFTIDSESCDSKLLRNFFAAWSHIDLSGFESQALTTEDLDAVKELCIANSTEERFQQLELNSWGRIFVPKEAARLALLLASEVFGLDYVFKLASLPGDSDNLKGINSDSDEEDDSSGDSDNEREGRTNLKPQSQRGRRHNKKVPMAAITVQFDGTVFNRLSNFGANMFFGADEGQGAIVAILFCGRASGKMTGWFLDVFKEYMQELRSTVMVELNSLQASLASKFDKLAMAQLEHKVECADDFCYPNVPLLASKSTTIMSREIPNREGGMMCGVTHSTEEARKKCCFPSLNFLMTITTNPYLLVGAHCEPWKMRALALEFTPAVISYADAAMAEAANEASKSHNDRDVESHRDWCEPHQCCQSENFNLCDPSHKSSSTPSHVHSLATANMLVQAALDIIHCCLNQEIFSTVEWQFSPRIMADDGATEKNGISKSSLLRILCRWHMGGPLRKHQKRVCSSGPKGPELWVEIQKDVIQLMRCHSDEEAVTVLRRIIMENNLERLPIQGSRECQAQQKAYRKIFKPLLKAERRREWCDYGRQQSDGQIAIFKLWSVNMISEHTFLTWIRDHSSGRNGHLDGASSLLLVREQTLLQSIRLAQATAGLGGGPMKASRLGRFNKVRTINGYTTCLLGLVSSMDSEETTAASSNSHTARTAKVPWFDIGAPGPLTGKSFRGPISALSTDVRLFGWNIFDPRASALRRGTTAEIIFEESVISFDHATEIVGWIGCQWDSGEYMLVSTDLAQPPFWIAFGLASCQLAIIDPLPVPEWLSLPLTTGDIQERRRTSHFVVTSLSQSSWEEYRPVTPNRCGGAPSDAMATSSCKSFRALGQQCRHCRATMWFRSGAPVLSTSTLKEFINNKVMKAWSVLGSALSEMDVVILDRREVQREGSESGNTTIEYLVSISPRQSGLSQGRVLNPMFALADSESDSESDVANQHASEFEVEHSWVSKANLSVRLIFNAYPSDLSEEERKSAQAVGGQNKQRKRLKQARFAAGGGGRRKARARSSHH